MFKLAAIFIGLLLSAPAYAIDNKSLLKQIDRNLNPESYEFYRKLINIEPDGRKKEYTIFSVKKGQDKTVALFIAPASENGRSTLRLGDNMWLYIPNVGKPIRITSLQSVVGGVFNNADILQLDYAAEYHVEKVEETGNEYLLHLKAKTKAVAYDKINLWADRDKKLPIKIECLTETNMLIKTLYMIHGHKAMLITDLAELYEVEPRVLVQAVKRNTDRFPSDFMFQLNEMEFKLGCLWQQHFFIS